jgi:hypothetical protein
MKKSLAVAAVALSFAPSGVLAQERAGDAALGALSGAVVCRLERWPARSSASLRGRPFHTRGGREDPNRNAVRTRPGDPHQRSPTEEPLKTLTRQRLLQSRRYSNPQHLLQNQPQQRSRRRQGRRPKILCRLSKR